MKKALVILLATAATLLGDSFQLNRLTALDRNNAAVQLGATKNADGSYTLNSIGTGTDSITLNMAVASDNNNQRVRLSGTKNSDGTFSLAIAPGVGFAFTADVSANGHKVTNLSNGVAATDAANKGQVDAVLSSTQVYYVKASGGNNANTGKDWANAFATLDGAATAIGSTTVTISSVVYPQTNQGVIVLSAGTHPAPSDTLTFLLVKGFKIVGMGKHQTYLTGLSGKPLFRFINCRQSRLEGFTYLGSPDHTGGLVEYDSRKPDFTTDLLSTDMQIVDVRIGMNNAAVGAVPITISTDGVTNTDNTFSSATITFINAAYPAGDVGGAITGAGIPDDTTITAVTGAHTVTLSSNTTATATGVNFTLPTRYMANWEDYGVNFNLYNADTTNDFNNDQALFDHVDFAGVKQCVLIGHSNSLEHRFQSCSFQRTGGIIQNYGGSFHVNDSKVGGSSCIGWMFWDRRPIVQTAPTTYHHSSSVTGLQTESGSIGLLKIDSDAVGTSGSNNVPVSVDFHNCDVETGGVRTGGSDNTFITDIRSNDPQCRMSWTGGWLKGNNSGTTISSTSTTAILAFSDCMVDLHAVSWAGILDVQKVNAWRTGLSGVDGLFPLTGGKIINRGGCTGFFSEVKALDDANDTIKTGRTHIYTSVALTANHTETLPAANTYVAGGIIRFTDLNRLGTWKVSFGPAGADTINGSASVFDVTIANAVREFVSDGTSNWTVAAVTQQGNIFNGASQLAQLDANGRILAGVGHSGNFALTNSGNYWIANTLTTAVQTLGSYTPDTSGIYNVVGRRVHFRNEGTNVFNNTSTAAFNVTLNGTVILTVTSGAVTTNATARPFIIDGDFGVLTTGQTGTIICHGFGQIMTNGNSAGNMIASASQGEIKTVDLRTQPVLGFQVTFGTNNTTANVCTHQMFSGEITN